MNCSCITLCGWCEETGGPRPCPQIEYLPSTPSVVICTASAGELSACAASAELLAIKRVLDGICSVILLVPPPICWRAPC